eukprot:GHUV01007157.1.p1 GENE.GHUV01007157.1~~GHUV01007157.1.p1  ORF type:complete len:143 (-),score=6.36 GHUV01007157.1:308-736(-)
MCKQTVQQSGLDAANTDVRRGEGSIVLGRTPESKAVCPYVAVQMSHNENSKTCCSPGYCSIASADSAIELRRIKRRSSMPCRRPSPRSLVPCHGCAGCKPATVYVAAVVVNLAAMHCSGSACLDPAAGGICCMKSHRDLLSI